MKLRPVFAVMLFAASAWGCAQEAVNTTASSSSPAGSEYVLASEPDGAQGVAHVRENAQDGDEIVVTGRIGGDHEPFVDGAAAFTIVDPQLQPCPPEEGCPTPWDYCCDLNLLAENKALVKLVDDQGQLVEADARQLLGVKELSSVVVRGQAQRDEAGNLTILARGVHVK